MSVIFEDIDHIQNLAFSFKEAIRIDKSLYYIQNNFLRKTNLIDNSFLESNSVIVQANVKQICSDGKIIYSLLDIGDIYQIDLPLKLLVSGKNYQWISIKTAIDQSHRGYLWKENKLIYTHCKHISSYSDKIIIITIGGKILNFSNNQTQPILQINGQQINSYFKKCLLFSFGGIVLTESGELYGYNKTLIKLKIKGISNISQTNKYLIAIKNDGSILQFSLDEIKSHEFFQNQTIFKRMNFCNEIEFKYKCKQFLQIEILSPDISNYCFAFIMESKLKESILNQCERSQHSNNRNSVMLLKQSLFEDWDCKQKKKQQSEMRRSTVDISEKQHYPEISVKLDTLSNYDSKQGESNQDTLSFAQKLATIRDSLNFEKGRSTIQQKRNESVNSKEYIDKQQQKNNSNQKNVQEIKIQKIHLDLETYECSLSPLKLDKLLNKVKNVKADKNIDQILLAQINKQDLQDSLPTFQNDQQFLLNETVTKNTEILQKNKNNNGISISSDIEQQNQSRIIKKQLENSIDFSKDDKQQQDLPLQLSTFEDIKNKNKKNKQNQQKNNEQNVLKVISNSNSVHNTTQQCQDGIIQTQRSSTIRSIDQAKQDLEQLVNIITKNKENLEQQNIKIDSKRKTIRISSPPSALSMPKSESKITPLKIRTSSAINISQKQESIKIPKRSISKINTQQSYNSINQLLNYDTKQIQTLQDYESDYRSQKIGTEQSISINKPLVRVQCTSQIELNKSIKTRINFKKR